MFKSYPRELSGGMGMGMGVAHPQRRIILVDTTVEKSSPRIPVLLIFLFFCGFKLPSKPMCILECAGSACCNLPGIQGKFRALWTTLLYPRSWMAMIKELCDGYTSQTSPIRVGLQIFQWPQSKLIPPLIWSSLINRHPPREPVYFSCDLLWAIISTASCQRMTLTGGISSPRGREISPFARC